MSRPRVLRLFLPATVGRLAYGILPLALFFTVAQATGSLGTAGLTAAALNLTVVLCGPGRARLIDRFGRRVLPAFASLYAVSTTLLVWAAQAHAPTPLLLLAAALVGACPPPLGPTMRTVWADLMPEGPLRLRALSLDAVVEEVLFTAGPLITGVAIAIADPRVALALALALMITGSAVFGFGPPTSRTPATADAADAATEAGVGLLRSPGFLPMLFTLAGLFAAMGLVDVAVPVTAAHAGTPATAGWLLAGMSAGSAVGGLLFGRRTWATPFARLLPKVALLLAALVAGLILLSPLWMLAAGLIVTGLLLSPSLIMAYALADELAPAGARTRASVWVNTAGNAGITTGTALAGALADHVPAQLLYAVAALVLLGTAALPGRRLARAIPVRPTVATS
ncbi:MFS family permease [Hamadaea flava]|uniref:MFS transporter n=1 Tax=Hamadaea flava TaxID=1742688 RepID=A0ABV8LMQ2_9ACTN|nr:MFS transporter [Hamadaea flava]MCP2324086.1 MFS family permease [Hamadaea flava]